MHVSRYTVPHALIKYFHLPKLSFSLMVLSQKNNTLENPLHFKSVQVHLVILTHDILFACSNKLFILWAYDIESSSKSGQKTNFTLMIASANSQIKAL